MATLSLCMITKNEQDHLAGCLKSVQSIVDEIIVVDTGSIDKTIDIAKSFGAKVYHFKWCDDFAAARNEAISHATSDYIFWLDADERLNQIDIKKLSDFKQKLPLTKDTAYAVEIVNYRKGKFPETAFQTRIFPNLPGISFKGPVCEQISFALAERGIKFKVSNLKIRHLGYLTDELWESKIKRNLLLLKKALQIKENCGEKLWDIHYYLGISYLNLGELTLAQNHLMQVLTDDCKTQNPFFYISASFELANLFRKEGETYQALQVLLKLKNEFLENDFVLYKLGKFFYEQKDYEEAKEVLLRCHPENIQLGVIPVCQQDYRFDYYQTLGFCLEFLGDIPKAIEMFRQAVKVKPHAFKLLAHLASLLLFETSETQEAIELLVRGIKGCERHGIARVSNQEVYVALCLMLAFVLAKQCCLEECVFIADRLLKVMGLPAARVVKSLNQLSHIYQEVGDNLQAENSIWSTLAFETANTLSHLSEMASS